VARIAGEGTVGFSDCTFTQWGGQAGDRHAIQVQSGTVLVRGCEFRQDRPQILLEKEVKRAIVTQNLFQGAERILNRSAGKTQISMNLSD
jgi:hypothetical protein